MPSQGGLGRQSCGSPISCVCILGVQRGPPGGTAALARTPPTLPTLPLAAPVLGGHPSVGCCAFDLKAGGILLGGQNQRGQGFQLCECGGSFWGLEWNILKRTRTVECHCTGFETVSRCLDKSTLTWWLSAFAGHTRRRLSVVSKSPRLV